MLARSILKNELESSRLLGTSELVMVSADYKKLECLWQRLAAGEPLSQSDEVVANEWLTHQEPFPQFVAKLAKVARAGATSSELFRVLEDECSLGFERARRYALHILFMFGDFPMEKLGGSAPLRSFTFAAAQGGSADTQTNAVHVLAAFASLRDKDAIELLEQLKTSEAQDVRLAANHYCSEIQESGSVSRIF